MVKTVKKTAHKGHDRTERMVAALAHEIKNPLNSMKGASQYLHDAYRNNTEIAEFTGIIIDEINRLERYLNEFLSFSRGTTLRLKMTDLQSFVTGTVMTVKHSYPVEIKITVKKASLPEVEIDAEQMKQVMVNFLSNAKDSLKGNPAPHTEIILDSDDRNAVISVKDNGKGIAPEVLRHIFEPFYTTKESGLGIGLSISRSIVQHHGGNITVESKPGKGTQFNIIIPLKRKGHRAK
ncbi:MAG: HAMP domain-containing histidine kinase [Spirochaetia bacterium]|nr:HAMP domain-containing histidine kinase [Spirochaetia bacterium]